MFGLLLFDLNLQLLHSGAGDALPLDGGLSLLIMHLNALHILCLNADTSASCR